MNKKIFDFLSSFGMMALGVFLILVCTVSFSSAKEKEVSYWRFPESGPRKNVNLITVNNTFPVSDLIKPIKVASPEAEPEVTAFAALAKDRATGEILFSKDAEKVRSLASVTKLMSSLVLVELPLKWNEDITVIADDCDDSSHHINPEEIYTRSELWNAALISSANGAIRALVRESGMTQEQFVILMNKKAQELSLNSLHFTDPTGLDAGNVGNAYDVAGLLEYALKIEKVKSALSKGSYILQPKNSSTERVIWSTNQVLTDWTPNSYNKKSIFGKTGYISDSRYNFVVSIKKNSEIIVVVMGAESAEARFTESLSIADWVFKNYVWNK